MRVLIRVFRILHVLLLLSLVLVLLHLFDILVMVAWTFRAEDALLWPLWDALRPLRGVLFLSVLVLVVALLAWDIYLYVVSRRRIRYLLDDTPPSLEAPTLPDHPYVDFIMDRRATYLGATVQDLPWGGTRRTDMFLTHSRHTVIRLLTLADGSEKPVVVMTTTFGDGYTFVTLFYAPRTRTPHDNIQGRHLHINVLRGTNIERVFLGHMSTVENLFPDWGAPNVLDVETAAEADTYLRTVPKTGRWRLWTAQLNRILVSGALYVIGGGLVLYILSQGWFLSDAATTLADINRDPNNSQLVYNFLMTMAALPIMFAAFVLAAPSYTPGRFIWASSLAIAPVFLTPFFIAPDNAAGEWLVLYGGLGGVGLLLAAVMSITRRVHRWRDWRAVR
ncbi:MAG: hypothetical protein AAF125_06265 [Chloroflexota bacterium]